MKAVMLSIKPKWCELIASSQKTIEIRKTVPKLKTPFRCYIYCTKDKQQLFEVMKDGDNCYGEIYHGKPVFIKRFTSNFTSYTTQKVIGEFMCDCIDICEYSESNYGGLDMDCQQLYDACLTKQQVEEYAKGESVYAWHISDLKIYDKPKELWEFKRDCGQYGTDHPLCDDCKYFIDGRSYEYDESDCTVCGYMPITRPPQSWCYVEEMRQ